MVLQGRTRLSNWVSVWPFSVFPVVCYYEQHSMDILVCVFWCTQESFLLWYLLEIKLLNHRVYEFLNFIGKCGCHTSVWVRAAVAPHPCQHVGLYDFTFSDNLVSVNGTFLWFQSAFPWFLIREQHFHTFLTLFSLHWNAYSCLRLLT